MPDGNLHAKLDSLLAQCDARRPFERLPAGHPQGGKYASEAAVREARWQRELRLAEENDRRRAAAAAKPAPKPAAKPATPKPAAAPRAAAARSSAPRSTPAAAPPEPRDLLKELREAEAIVNAPSRPARRKPFKPTIAPPTGHGIMGPNIPLTNAQRGGTTTPSIWDRLKQRAGQITGIKTEQPSETASARGKDVTRILKEEYGGKVPGATNEAYRELVRKNPALWGKIHQQMEANRQRPSAPVRALQSVGKRVGSLIESLKPIKIGGETRGQFERRMKGLAAGRENPVAGELERVERKLSTKRSGGVHRWVPPEHEVLGDSVKADAAPAQKFLTHQK